MRAWIGFVGLLLVMSGCVTPGNQASAEATAHTQLEALWNLDFAAFEATRADRYFDFGSGTWIQDASSGYREFFESDGTKADMARFDTWRDLVILDEVKTGTMPGLGDDAAFFQHENFSSQTQDIVWFAPPAPDSPLADGWGGLYREIDGRWVQVGGD